MKGQMSIQMIIVVIILLVVAVVAIRIFINRMSETKSGISQVINNLDDFEIKCQALCNEYKMDGSNKKLSEFCYTKMGSDLNKNGRIDAFKAKTKILDVCEDSIYCFHVVDCVDWSECRKAACDRYVEEYGDEDKADLKVNSLFDKGSCDLEIDWKKFYFGDMPCIFPPNKLGLRNCIYDGNRFSCQTNCRWENGKEVVLVVVDPPKYCQVYMNKNGQISPNGISLNLVENKIIVDGFNCLSGLSSDKGNWVVTLVCTGMEEDTAAIKGVG
ncbi:MAG: hypothetical protein QXY45_00865 [Candidatus Aenigmatarchaeota archaeon]